MKIHHLNLTVTDVSATQEFLETYFGMTGRANRGKGFAVILDNVFNNFYSPITDIGNTSL
jgi:catechol 2,3-dioxygenase-like lactoylglutathione lyase family enzyme